MVAGSDLVTANFNIVFYDFQNNLMTSCEKKLLKTTAKGTSRKQIALLAKNSKKLSPHGILTQSLKHKNDSQQWTKQKSSCLYELPKTLSGTAVVQIKNEVIKKTKSPNIYNQTSYLKFKTNVFDFKN